MAVRDAGSGFDAGSRKVAMGASENPDQIRPALRQAEEKLARHLEEACEDQDPDSIAEASMDELLRLEEELLAAARAVDEAVRLRRRLGEGNEGAEKQLAASEQAPADRSGTRLREFRTASGSEWRVWEVRPGASGRPRKLDLYPADYAQGWLAFELLSGERRKRLPKFASEWAAAPDADLERWLEQAVDAPLRKGRPTESSTSSSPTDPGPAP
jgi:hypothetical protein